MTAAWIIILIVSNALSLFVGVIWGKLIQVKKQYKATKKILDGFK